jgi:hypothetical protein
MLTRFRKSLYPMFAPEDNSSASQRREEMARETLEDINLMDDVMSGKIPESQIIQEDSPAELTKEPEAKDADTTEVSDNMVASADPTTVDVDSTTTTRTETKTELETTDDYDFVDFLNSMSRDALGKKSATTPPTPVVSTPTTIPKPVTPQPAAVAPKMTLEVPQDLCTIDEMNAAFQDPAKMMELFGKIYLRAASDGAQSALMRLPDVARPLFAQEHELATLAREFYEKNPELNNYRDFVQYCATQVESKNPGWTPRQIFEETARVAKQKIPMLKEAATRQKRAAAKPAFVDAQSQKGTNKPSSGKLSALEAELAAMPDGF